MTVEELKDEIDAINAIYPSSTCKRSQQIYDCIIPQHENLVIQLSFPTEYPDEKPWCVQAVSHNQTKYLDLLYIERNVNEIIDRLFVPGMVVLYELFEELEAFLEKYNVEAVYQSNEPTPEITEAEAEAEPKETETEIETVTRSVKKLSTETYEPTALWIQSEPIVDRGSTFIAYAREVHSVEEAEEYLDDLITDKRIARASHNISSWRIRKNNGVQYQDCDDDGETAAGGRLLHLLTVRSNLLSAMYFRFNIKPYNGINCVQFSMKLRKWHTMML